MASRHRLMHQGNAIGVWMHHAFKGRLDAFGDQTVLMITSPGRRTGRPRSTMVRYLDHDGGYEAKAGRVIPVAHVHPVRHQ